MTTTPSSEDAGAEGQEDADRALYEALAADARKTEEDAANALDEHRRRTGRVDGRIGTERQRTRTISSARERSCR